MDAADVIGVAAEHGALHVAFVDHVERHHQEALLAQPARVPDHRAGQLDDAAGAEVAGEQQVQHRHEVALAGAERAVQVAGRTATALDRAADDAERLVESGDELRGDDVAGDGRLGRRVSHALRQLEHEVVGLDPLGNLDQVAEQRAGFAHARAALRARGLRTGAGGVQARNLSGATAKKRASSSMNSAK